MHSEQQKVILAVLKRVHFSPCYKIFESIPGMFQFDQSSAAGVSCETSQPEAAVRWQPSGHEHFVVATVALWSRFLAGKVGDPEEAAPSELGKATQTLAQQYMVYYGMWTFSAVVLA